ncbi:MAG: DUF1353 domain-containing protein [Deltaproteobacteria bacterium]|nr:DUF1353 domain-containing protein [Deltaproteobacteria bacterium]
MKITNLPDIFLTDLVLRWVADGKWAVHEPFIINSKIVGRIEVTVGTLTDGPSIPKIPVLYEKFRDRAWPAAVPHDFGYDDDCPYDFPREVWDDVFHELMDALYPGWIDRIRNDEEWAGVRLGGESHFRVED